MRLLALSILFLTNALWSAEYSLFLAGKKQTIVIEEYQKVSINDLCLKNIVQCKAFIASKKENKRPLASNGISPATHLCQAVGGESITLKDKINNEYDYCLFDDLTMILSSDLLTKGHK